MLSKDIKSYAWLQRVGMVYAQTSTMHSRTIIATKNYEVVELTEQPDFHQVIAISKWCLK